jgi:hypothetical protein
MKKIIYILLFAFSSALIVTSCTEEEVAPTMETPTSGGGSGNGGTL